MTTTEKYFFSQSYERTEKMFLYRQLGVTLRLIGKKFNVSGNRVMQMLRKRDRMVNWHKEFMQLEAGNMRNSKSILLGWH